MIYAETNRLLMKILSDLNGERSIVSEMKALLRHVLCVKTAQMHSWAEWDWVLIRWNPVIFRWQLKKNRAKKWWKSVRFTLHFYRFTLHFWLHFCVSLQKFSEFWSWFASEIGKNWQKSRLRFKKMKRKKKNEALVLPYFSTLPAIYASKTKIFYTSIKR